MFGGYARAGGLGHEFSKKYRCYSVALAPTQQKRDDVEFGGKIFLPASALEELAMLNISYPMLFKVTNEKTGMSTHCGVLEFNAREGQCHLPYWMMRMLGLNEEELISIKNVTLPLGRFVKVQPQSLEFLDVSNPRAVLEHELAKFSCLSANDIISIKFNNKKFELKIVETLPANAICIVETDVEVDFAPPPGYVEPQRPPSASGVPLGTSPNQQLLQAAAQAAADDPNTFVAFRGQGNRIKDRGIPIQSTSPSVLAPTPANSISSFGASMLSSSPKPFGSYSPSSAAAAPLNLPRNKLVFAPSSSAPPPLFTGNSTTPPNDGIIRTTGVAQSTTTGFKPFSGQGHSLK